jgi:hypothetical protein
MDSTTRETSRIAIASIICCLAAVVSWTLFFLFGFADLNSGIFLTVAIPLFHIASALGLIAILVIAVQRKVLKGYIYAVLAIIMSFPFLFFDYGIKVQAQVREKRKRELTGLYNLELLGKEFVQYAKDNDGHLPEAEKWCDLLLEHNKNLTRENFKHPQPVMLQLQGKCHFAFNKNLSRRRLAEIPGDVVLLFEADGDWNLTGTGELLATRYSDKGWIPMLFVNGSVRNYWYYMEAIRNFDSKGTYMFYEKARWTP